MVPPPPPPEPQPPVGVWSTKYYSNYRYIPYFYKHTYGVEERLWDADKAHHFFFNNWHLSIAISILYGLIIWSLQRWMQRRRPFQLQWPLIGWNAALAVLSTVGAWRMSEEFIYVLTDRGVEDSVCIGLAPYGPAPMWGLIFSVSKVAELFDTVFLSLRKRPLSFLHCYHHAVVLIFCWHAASEITSSGRWFISMNYSVHALMYTYYTCTSLGLHPPRLISMGMTCLQTAQMLVGLYVSGLVTYVKVFKKEVICQQSWTSLILCFVLYASFAVLFIQFFISAYIDNKKKRAGKQKKGE